MNFAPARVATTFHAFSYLEANGVFLKVVIAAMVTFLFSEFIAIYPIFSNYEKQRTVLLQV